MSEPRWWTIRLCALVLNDRHPKTIQFGDETHVIEKSAYDTLRADLENERARSLRYSLQAQKIAKENLRLREALAFYADTKKGLKETEVIEAVGEGPFASFKLIDDGTKAREALREETEQTEGDVK